MTKQKLSVWFTLFDTTKDKFKWFFDKYCHSVIWDNLMDAREREDYPKMDNIMNGVWFELPDHIFNIDNNPPGWSEFLNLLEQ